MELMPSRKLIGAVVILSLLLVVPQVAAQENRENINYVTQAQLENVVANQKRLENSVGSLRKSAESMKDSIESLKASFKELSDTVRELSAKGEAGGGTITVVALTENGMKPLNFGGMFGGGPSSMMMFAMMQRRKGGGMFSIPMVEPVTPVMLMGRNGLVQDATIDAYATSENGFMPVNLQVSGGMTVIPPVGKFISGTISAPNYDETTFYVKVGKAKGKKKPKAGEVEIRSTPATLRPGEGAVVKAVRNGKIVEGTTLSILGVNHPNPAQITVPKGQPSLYVEVLKDGKTIASKPLPIRGGSTGGGWSIPWSWIVISGLIALVAWKYRYKIPYMSSRRVT